MAQTPSIAQAPGRIAFPQWQQTGDFEFYDRFEVSLPSDIRTPYEENNSFRVITYIPKDSFAPHPAVLILHYLGASDLGLEFRLAQRLASRGIAAAVMELPYHVSRTPEGFRSGELAVTPDVENLKRAMVQSVRDARRAIDFLANRGEIDGNRISISGSSLGSIVSAAVFGVDDRLQAASFLLGGIDLAHILWNSSRVVDQRDELRRQGFNEDSLRESLREIEPQLLLESESRKALVIGARFDTVIPPADTEKLIAMLVDPEVLWLDTGHFGPALAERAVLANVVRFFESQYFGSEFSPTDSGTPTLRLGIQYTNELDLQIVGGVDVWKSNDRSDVYLSILLTPEEVQGWLGVRLTGNFSAGLSFQPSRIDFGLMWSIVL